MTGAVKDTTIAGLEKGQKGKEKLKEKRKTFPH